MTRELRRLGVTVVIPVRNEANRVEATMEGLLRQTRLPDEIVVADGQSDDATLDRVRRFEERGVPVRIVTNATLFAGGGRNAATRAARHEVLVNADVGNVPAPDWLAEMVRPFEQDPALDFLGGAHLPLADSARERVFAAVVHADDFAPGALDEAQVRSRLADDFVPGGMCMAWRRSVWDRSGGFCEWARKGQDRLFGHRVRRVGGKVALTFHAVVRHHMARTLPELFRRHYFYALWSSRLGLSQKGVLRLLLLAGLLVGSLAGTLVTGWAWIPFLVILLAYLWAGAWRKLAPAAAVMGARFGLWDHARAAGVLLTRDTALLAGGLLGALDARVRPVWRRRTHEYLEHGR